MGVALILLSFVFLAGAMAAICLMESARKINVARVWVFGFTCILGWSVFLGLGMVYVNGH